MEFEVGGEGVGFYLVVDRVWSGGGEGFGCGRCGSHDMWCYSLRGVFGVEKTGLQKNIKKMIRLRIELRTLSEQQILLRIRDNQLHHPTYSMISMETI